MDGVYAEYCREQYQSRVNRPRYECYFFDEGLDHGAAYFAYTDVGKGREQDAVSFGYFFLLLKRSDSRTYDAHHEVLNILVCEIKSR